MLRLVLDFAEVDPNPGRHRSVMLPAGRTANVRIRLPSSSELAAIRAELPAGARRVLDFLEDTGAEISAAVELDQSRRATQAPLAGPGGPKARRSYRAKC